MLLVTAGSVLCCLSLLVVFYVSLLVVFYAACHCW